MAFSCSRRDRSFDPSRFSVVASDEWLVNMRARHAAGAPRRAFQNRIGRDTYVRRYVSGE